MAAKDERLQHEALVTYVDLCHFHVHHAWRDDVIQAIGENIGDLMRWRATIKDWLGMGWSPRNVKGMLECYRRGETIGGQRGQQTQESALAEWKQRGGSW